MIVFVTSSVDGKIASRTGDSRLSCPHDLKRLHQLRAEVDAVAVGANTAIVDNPQLTVRYVKGRNPLRVLIDGELKVPTDLRIFTKSPERTVVFTSKKVSEEKVRRIRNTGVKVVQLEPKYGFILSTREVAEYLFREFQIKSLLVEGGGELLWHFISEGVVDEFRVTLSPYIIGGREAVGTVMGEGFTDKSTWFKLRLLNIEVCGCGNEVHLIYVRE